MIGSLTARSAVALAGLVLALLAPQGPETFWCPMHPDVRSAAAGACVRCGMALVPIPPPAFHDDRLEVRYAASSPTRGRLTLRVIDPATNVPVRSFQTVHDRPLHLFVVSRDLVFFDHVHPTPASDGTFRIDLTLPGPGAYALYVDAAPAGGAPQFLQTMLVTPDYRGSPLPDSSALAGAEVAERVVGDLRVTLGVGAPGTSTSGAGSLIAGRDQTLTFTVSDARTGAPISDLQPYLAAPGHLLIASAALSDAMHSHPSDQAAGGPELRFTTRFARPGLYKMWLQVQRAGRVVTVPFVVRVM